MTTRTFAFIVAIVIAIQIHAQPLADKVPADSLVYIGWAGVDQMKGYDGSHLQGILQAANLQQAFAAYIPRLLKKAGSQDPDAAEITRVISVLGGPMWHHPSAFYFQGVELPNPNAAPEIRLGFLCEAGADAQAMTDAVQSLIQRMGRGAPPIKVSNNGGLVAVTMGRTAAVDALLGGPAGAGPAAALAKRAEFSTAMAAVHKDPVAAVFIDTEAALKMAEDLMAKGGADPDTQANWPKIRDVLGLQSLKRIAWSAGFDGKDWASDAVLLAPAPRSGLIGAMAAGPLSEDALAVIPKSATLGGAGQFDFAAVFSMIRDGIRKFDPNAAQQFDRGVAQVNRAVKLDIENDVLKALGRDWTVYIDPPSGGSGILGFTIVNRPADPAKLEQSLSKLEIFANGMMTQAGRQEGMQIAFHQLKSGDANIHYLSVPLVTPSWSIVNSHLYISLYPQVLIGAIAHGASKKNSILANPQFTQMRQRLGVNQTAAIRYMDLPQTAPGSYQTLLAVSRLYLGLGDMFGLDSPPLFPPPLSAITPHLTPAMAAQWTDDAGIHWRNVSPFPGSELLGESGIGASVVGQQALLISILLPSLNRARETANRVKCASNMRQIGQAMLLYSNEHRAAYPPDLGTLVKTEDISIEVFVCPSSGTSIPPDVRGGTPDQQAKWINEHSDYVYLGKGLTNSAPADRVVVYEKENDHRRDGMNLLYADGHVEFNNMPAAQKEIQNATKKKGPGEGEL